MTLALAANEDFTRSPVNVVKLQSNDLASTKAETSEQKKDGVVTPATGGSTVADFQHTLDFLRTHVLGYGGLLSVRHS